MSAAIGAHRARAAFGPSILAVLLCGLPVRAQQTETEPVAPAAAAPADSSSPAQAGGQDAPQPPAAAPAPDTQAPAPSVAVAPAPPQGTPAEKTTDAERMDAPPRPPPAPAAGSAADWSFRFGLEGYYRTRTVHISNLADEQLKPVVVDPETSRSIEFPRITSTDYILHRLRLTPSMTLVRGGAESGKVVARAYAQLDVLNDVVWGDNNARSSAPLFAVNPTNAGYLGEVVPDLQVSRAWVELKLPVGELRVGRMPSHWGMGILANGGGTFQFDPASPPDARRLNLDTYFGNDFGDSHFGSTNDRILFATRPVEVATLGRTKSNLLAAYAFDKISEAPLLADEPFARQFRPYSESGFLSQDNAVNEHVMLALYKNQDWHPGTPDELWGGVYVVLRTQDKSCTNPSKETDGKRECDADTGSFVQIYDLYGKLRRGPLYAEGEAFTIRGETFGGVPAPANSKQKAEIYGAVGRLGLLGNRWDFIAEAGYASGDEDLYGQEEGSTFGQRPLHPDYNVGLILYEETLRERTARRLAAGAPGAAKPTNPDGAKGFASLGGVVDSVYLNPRVRFRAPGKLSGLKAVAGVLAAWLDTYNFTGAYFPEGKGRGKYLGTEFDLGVHFEFFGGHALLGVETGYLLFGDAFRTDRAPDYASPGSFTLQSRLALVGW